MVKTFLVRHLPHSITNYCPLFIDIVPLLVLLFNLFGLRLGGFLWSLVNLKFGVSGKVV